MHYNFKRLSGQAWFDLIKRLRGCGLTFLEVKDDALYDNEQVNNTSCVYFNRTTSRCKIIYYDYKDKWRKKFREISFSAKDIDPVQCVLTFKKVAKTFNESVPYEQDPRPYTNGVYTYYKGNYDGEVTVLDMNSAYAWVLTQPLADVTTKQEVTVQQVMSKEFDYYCFENDIWKEMFYKEQQEEMQSAMIWADVKIYGFKSKVFYGQTARELFRLKQTVNKEKYKNVANIAVGCMHKRSGKQNNITIAASLYAYFEWYIKHLVDNFEKKGYKVIMISTDSIKVVGDYDPNDNIVTIGTGLGEFKVEYKGLGKYFSTGHYEEDKIKWKGKPMYMIEGHSRCQFIDNLEKEKEVYEKYAIY